MGAGRDLAKFELRISQRILNFLHRKWFVSYLLGHNFPGDYLRLSGSRQDRKNLVPRQMGQTIAPDACYAPRWSSFARSKNLTFTGMGETGVDFAALRRQTQGNAKTAGTHARSRSCPILALARSPQNLPHRSIATAWLESTSRRFLRVFNFLPAPL